MKKKYTYLVALVSLLMLMGCVMEPQEPQLTPLQIQALQTKSFKSSKRKVFNSTVQVFQDLGYTVSNANFDTGFISAQSMTKDGDANLSGFWKFMKVVDEMNSKHKEKKTNLVKATAFISELPSHQARVRLSFVDANSSSVDGGSFAEHDNQILDSKVYTDMFTRIEQSLFVGTAV